MIRNSWIKSPKEIDKQNTKLVFSILVLTSNSVTV